MSNKQNKEPLNFPAQLSVAAIVLLGLIGGSLVIAHGGFETSPKRGGQSIFVPPPLSYFIAAIMYSMSMIGMLAIIKEWQWSRITMALAFVIYTVVAFALVFGIASM